MHRTSAQLLAVVLLGSSLLAWGLGASGADAAQTSATQRDASKAPKGHFSLSAADKSCLSCHGEANPGMVAQWKRSRHSVSSVGCTACHMAEPEHFAAIKHYGFVVKRQPTAADCAQCHGKQNDEFLKSRHAILGLNAGNDPNMNWRKPPIYGKTMGCANCHAGMGNYWPDKSLGDCTQCHNKHDFTLAQARKPETCKRCHEGGDHGNWESFQNSKHGLVYFDRGSTWNWSYKPGPAAPPFDGPVCATCHMSGAKGLNPTHNVSERSSWRLASPISFRTTWGDESWQPKRARMEQVCDTCHARSVTKRVFLATDLAVYQFNELFKVLTKMRAQMNKEGKLTANNDDDDPYDIVLREVWHDTGRVYRASLMHFAPNKNEAYGYSPMTYQSYELIAMAAEKGVHEAEKWAKTDGKDKVWFYPWFDYGGSIWGQSNIILTNNYWYAKPDYWERVKANVEFVYKKGILSDEQWAMWNEWYKEKEKYMNRTEKDFPPQHKDLLRQLDAARGQQAEIMNWKLPGAPLFTELWEMGYPKAAEPAPAK